ncbi:unnamed protein product [Effrenium voratum]|nr:unnamed protein product [Effrenium voratum]
MLLSRNHMPCVLFAHFAKLSHLGSDSHAERRCRPHAARGEEGQGAQRRLQCVRDDARHGSEVFALQRIPCGVGGHWARRFAGLGGFHTSILICGEDYYFCPMGIRFSPKLVSHPRPHEALRLRVGVSQATGTELLNFLADHFQSGSYDFLRKNCNSFTDCALYYLCGKRLDFRYRAMEKLGWIAESQTGFLGTISEGEYTANPAAEDFDLEELLEQIEDARGESEEELELELPHAPSVPMVGCWPGIPGL